MRTRGGADVLDARHPGAVVGVVVLGSERLQAEARTAERQRDDVVIRDERVGHIASLHATLRRPRPTPRCRS